MGRAGYNEGDCCDTGDFLRMCGWNANVKRCIAGRAGQAFLWELYHSLYALPQRALVHGALEATGAYCSLGAVFLRRGMEIPANLREVAEDVDDYELAELYEGMGGLLGIKDMLAREVMYQNDDCDDTHYAEGPALPFRYGPTRPETPEERWRRMVGWVVGQLRNVP